MSKKPKAGWLRKVGLALAAFSLAMSASELGLRLFRLAPAAKVIALANEDCVYKRSTNPVLGFELKSKYRHDSPNFIESYESTNSYGQRDVERSLSKAEKQRILLLGDSVVEGYGLPFEKTIARQLEAIYAEQQQEVEVLNFGVSAYCTLAEIELLATKGLRFDPDIVVLVFVENDFDDFNREAFPLGNSIPRPKVVQWLFEHSYLCRLAFFQLDLFQFRAEVDPVTWNKLAIGENNVARALTRFRQLAQEHDFKPVIAVWPRFEQDRIVDPHLIPEQEQLIVEALAAANELSCFRLSDYFRQQMNSDGRSPRLLFSQGDQVHPSEFGARVAAQAIHARLSQSVEFGRHGNTTGTKPADIEKAINQIAGRHPNYARVFNRIGNRLLKDGEPQRAIEQYQKALLEDPDNAGSHNNMGIALERCGGATSRTDAIAHYRRAIEIHPDFAEAHFNLGNAVKEESVEETKACWIKAIQLQPTFVKAHFALSKILLDEGKKRAAEAGFRQVLQLQPDHTLTLRALANELAKQQRYAEARNLYERCVALERDDAELLNNLGAICALLGDRSAAIDALKAAVAADPNHPKALENLRKLQHAEK